jgi:hypothetical protein
MILPKPQKQSWLIRADRQHIVRAEGFALAELDDKLEKL